MTSTVPVRNRILQALITLGAAYLSLKIVLMAARYMQLIGWRHPFLDQFRLYPLYLELPFPENVMQIENGHRPVLPALIRVFEIHTTHADQTLQIIIGGLAAFVVAIIGAVVHRRFDQAPWSSTLLALLAGCIGVFWMANSRMLLHGNESVHAYFAASFSLLAFLIAWRASRRRCLRCFAVAILSAFAAGLSFGPGVAAFGLILLAPIIAGNWRFLAISASVTGAFAAAYVLILPQGSEASGVLQFAPMKFVSDLFHWLGSAVVHAGIGVNPRFNLPEAAAIQGAPLAWLSADPWATPVVLVAVGLAILMTLHTSWTLYRTPDALPRLALVGVGFCWFGLGVAFLVCLARSELFTQLPDQRFADRYLLWSCMFFLGFWFQIQAGLGRTLLAQATAMVLLVSVFLCLKVPDKVIRQWAIAVHQLNERTAGAMLLGVDDPELYASDPAAPEAARRKTVALFRAQRLGVFADATESQVQALVSNPPSTTTELAKRVGIIMHDFQDPRFGNTHVFYSQFEPGADIPKTVVLVSASAGVCGIARRVLVPNKPNELLQAWSTIHFGLSGYSACPDKQPIQTWSADVPISKPVVELELIRL